MEGGNHTQALDTFSNSRGWKDDVRVLFLVIEMTKNMTHVSKTCSLNGRIE